MTEYRERLQLIGAIVEKDLKVTRWAWLAAIVVAITAGILTWGAAANAAYSMRFNPYFAFTWNDGLLRAIYAAAAGLTSFVLGLSFSSVYSGEVRKGTIRSIMLYPVDMNDVTIAKLASSFLLMFGISAILWIGFFGSFFAYGVYPIGDFWAILLMAMLMSFLALATGVFLAQILAHYARRMVVSPSALGALFMLFAVLLTQTAVYAIGQQLLLLSAASRGTFPTPQEFEALDNAARAISVLSPQHMGARILGDVFRLAILWPDIHVVVPVAIVVLVGGYVLGRKLYLDIFIR